MQQGTHRSAIILAHDSLAVGLASCIAWVVAWDLGGLAFSESMAPWGVGLVVMALVGFPACGLHRRIWSFTAVSDLLAIAQAVTLVLAAWFLSMLAIERALVFPLSGALLIWLLMVVLMSASRLAYRRHKLSARRGRGRVDPLGRTPVLLFGSAPSMGAFVTALDEAAVDHLRVVGLLEPTRERTGRSLQGLPYLGAITDLDRILVELAAGGVHPQRLIATSPAFELGEEARTAIERAQARHDLEVDYASLVPGIGDAQASQWVAREDPPPFRIDDRRRVFDILASGVLLLLAAPLMLLVGAAVLVDLGPPILFRQVRPGRGLRAFTLLKFRTMRPPMTPCGRVLGDDDRTTAITRLIRRLRLDELPQLWNVLTGDMSLIGPRPLLTRDLHALEDGVQRYRVRPGITGWAQVNGGHQLTPAEKAALDAWYVEHRSARLDLEILLLTLRTALFGERIGLEALHAAGARRPSEPDGPRASVLPFVSYSRAPLGLGAPLAGEAIAGGQELPGHIFSIDVEDWFHILDVDSAPPIREWTSLPSRVERNLYRLLDLLSAHDARATLFFVGWVAERFPNLVREAQARGHKTGSHSYAHRLVTTLAPGEFEEDARRARGILQDISGDAVAGYRAPGFSLTGQTPWFFERLAEVGHTYDCSLFPGHHGHGGIRDSQRTPHVAFRSSRAGQIIEVPASVVPILGRSVCLFGGGYLRLFPSALIKAMANRVSATGDPVVLYIHPRDIDPDQPRLPMSAARRFKCYVNLGTTYAKLDELLRAFRFVSVEEYLRAAPIGDAGWQPLKLPGVALRGAGPVEAAVLARAN